MGNPLLGDGEIPRPMIAGGKPAIDPGTEGDTCKPTECVAPCPCPIATELAPYICGSGTPQTKYNIHLENLVMPDGSGIVLSNYLFIGQDLFEEDVTLDVSGLDLNGDHVVCNDQIGYDPNSRSGGASYSKCIELDSPATIHTFDIALFELTPVDVQLTHAFIFFGFFRKFRLDDEAQGAYLRVYLGTPDYPNQVLIWSGSANGPTPCEKELSLTADDAYTCGGGFVGVYQNCTPPTGPVTPPGSASKETLATCCPETACSPSCPPTGSDGCPTNCADCCQWYRITFAGSGNSAFNKTAVFKEYRFG